MICCLNTVSVACDPCELSAVIFLIKQLEKIKQLRTMNCSAPQHCKLWPTWSDLSDLIHGWLVCLNCSDAAAFPLSLLTELCPINVGCCIKIYRTEEITDQLFLCLFPETRRTFTRICPKERRIWKSRSPTRKVAQ